MSLANQLLTSMSEEDFALIAPHLKPVDCPLHYLIAEPARAIRYVYFLESGIGSIVVTTPEGLRAEVGLFGREGFSPTDVLVSDQTPYTILMQGAGEGNRIALSAFHQVIGESRTLQSLLARYANALSIQTAYTAVSNAAHHLEVRLARWLLMCHDRIDGYEMALTHEFLAVMLAVRRPSVTTALHVFEGNGLIRAERGLITICDRAALEVLARDAYGKPEEEYRRLLGTPLCASPNRPALSALDSAPPLNN